MLPNIASVGWLTASNPNFKSRQVPGDVAGVKRGTGKGADGVGSAGGLALLPHGGVVEVRPEDPHGGSERIRPHRRLTPAHHLRVKPGGLRGIGTARALAPDQEIAAAFAPLAVGRNLQPAVEGALDHLGADANPVGPRQDMGGLRAVSGVLDVFGGVRS